MRASRYDVRINSTMYTHMCRTMESGRSSACKLSGLSRTTSGPSGITGTVPSVSSIESADESDMVQEQLHTGDRTPLMPQMIKPSIITDYDENNVEFC